MELLCAIDAGTTGVRTLAMTTAGAVLDVAYRPLTQFFPEPGWVEHDANEILAAVESTLVEVIQRQRAAGNRVAAIGITNQRETTVAFDRATGAPLARAIVWQDRRTAATCDELRSRGVEHAVRTTTGLVLDPYFSATKMAWLLDHGVGDGAGNLALATIDTWVLWNLTGGPNGGTFATDVSNASRTMVLNLATGTWDEGLLETFGIPATALAEVRPTVSTFGTLRSGLGEQLAGLPITAMVGDQQGALFGQSCTEVGMAKATYGTGCFVLQNIGTTIPAPPEGLTTSIAWQLGSDQPLTYALEGSAFVAGATVQWLRDELGIIERSEDLEPLALTAASSDGVMIVPAFTGLGSPWFDPEARGTIFGLSLGSGRAQIARATIEALAYQVTAMTDAMVAASGAPLGTLRVDGGASAMDLLCQLQAEQLGTSVERPASVETTALGAAMLAGLGAGVIDDVASIAASWQCERRFSPELPNEFSRLGYDAWLAAVAKSHDLAT